jgi:hypothetical protein
MVRVFESRVLRKVFSLRGRRKQGTGEGYIMRSLWSVLGKGTE